MRGNGSCPELTGYIHCRNCPVYTDAATQLLDASSPASYLTEWTRHYTRPNNEAVDRTHTLFIFRLGNDWLSLPVDALKEVAPLRTIHSLPHRQGGIVRGITNVRGELLVCISLEKVLGLEPSAAKPEKRRLELQRLLVVQGEGGALAFSVDEAHGIQIFASPELTEVPATVSQSTAVYTHAVVTWQGHSVGCLERHLLLAALNRSLT